VIFIASIIGECAWINKKMRLKGNGIRYLYPVNVRDEDKPKHYEPLGDRGMMPDSVKKEEEAKQKPNEVEDILCCFSFTENFKKLWTPGKEDDPLNMTFGLRFFSIMWIILGNTYAARSMFLTNPMDTRAMMESRWYLLVLGWDYSVDSFYWISGFTAAVVCIGRMGMRKNDGPLGWVKGALSSWGHKLYKVWPVYIALLLYYWKIMPHLGDGPVWHKLVDYS